jgi:DNA-binding NtrC family response regulator
MSTSFHPQHGGQSARHAGGSVSALDVIVADDDPGVRGSLQALLAAMGARVQLAASGWELLSLLAEAERIDLVIVDVHMPMPNGIEVLAMARVAGVSAPFVLITGAYTEALTAAARRLRAATLAKPFSAADLREQIGKARETVVAPFSARGPRPPDS